MRMLALFFVLSGCGRSECQDYVTLYCGRVQSCLGVAGNISVCEEAGMKQLQAARTTEETCKGWRETMQTLSCEQFRAAFARASR